MEVIDPLTHQNFNRKVSLWAGSGPIRLKGGSFIKEFKTENTDTVDGNSTISGWKNGMRSSFNVESRGSANFGGGINLIKTMTYSRIFYEFNWRTLG